MSDLARFRRALAAIEKSGKRHKRELAALREEVATQAEPMTRSQENRIKWLDQLIKGERNDWQIAWQKVRDEERRLIDNPEGFLRFT